MSPVFARDRQAQKPRPAAKSVGEEELKSIIQHQVDIATGHIGGEITETRRTLLEQYRGEPYGNEVEGRSKVVSSDIFDTIESMLPDLMEVFTAGDRIVEFQPEEEGDEEHSDLATDYCNWIFSRDNPGWTILYDLFKDALLQINGVAKVYWDDSEVTKTYRYENLSEDELTILSDDEEVEIIEAEERLSNELLAAANTLGFAEQLEGLPVEEVEAFLTQTIPTEMLPQIKTFDVKLKRTATKGRMVIENVPPEEFLISRRSKTIDTSDFCAHKTRKTVTDLIQMGFDPELVRSIPTHDEAEYNEERVERFSRDDEWPYESEYPDESTRTIWVIECYVRVDFDNDGIGELRKVTVAGADYTILENEEVSEAPFITVTPIREPHKFFGRAVAEIVQDIQKIKTVVWRQLMDNMYSVNNNRHAINERVDEDDALSNVFGGVIKVSGNDPIGDSIQPLVTQSLGPFAYPLLEYLDTIREVRTGITRYSQGLDADSLNKTATGISRILARTQRRIQLVARLFAESGIKDLFGKILRGVIEHQDTERAVRLRGKEWQIIDPRSWNSNMDLIVNVGLGYGTPESRQEGAMAILQIQKQIIEFQGGMDGPMVFGHHVRNAVEAAVEGWGFKSADPYFAEIKEGQKVGPEEAPPNPEMLKLQATMEGKKMDAQVKMQTEQMTDKRERDFAQVEDERERMKIALEDDRERAKIGLDARKADLDYDVKSKAADGKSKDRPTEQVVVAGSQESVSQMGEMLAGFTQQLQEVAANLVSTAGQITEAVQEMNKPKRILRDPATGRAEAIEVAEDEQLQGLV